MSGSSIPARTARTAWAGTAAAGLILLCLGLGRKFYFGAVANAFERDRLGNTLILAGVVLELAARSSAMFPVDCPRSPGESRKKRR